MQLLSAGLGQHWLLGKCGLDDRPAWNSSGFSQKADMVEPTCGHGNPSTLLMHPARGDARGVAEACCG